MINKCWSHVILQWSPIFVTSCISGHYWMKLLYSRPTKQPPTFLKNTASSAHYEMANDIPSGHLLCCNFPLVWHAPPILWTPFIVGPFYIHLRPPIRTYRKLNCMKLMKGVVLLDSEEKLPHFVWRPSVDEFVELALLTWKQICNANLSFTLRGLFL